MKRKYITGSLTAPAGDVPVVAARWRGADLLGAIKVRLSIGRASYRVRPGLYAIGNPTAGSNIFVSANYKLSFDILRRNLAGIDGWILVLDTRGINVWCAAGKGAFGTEELINRIKLVQLDKIVRHRRLILPQLAAPGIAAHQVRSAVGFSVTYGPVRAPDIKPFLAAGMKATDRMRTVRFDFIDRLLLLPVELVNGAKYLLVTMALFFLMAGLSKSGYSPDSAMAAGLPALTCLLAAYIGGTVIGPLMLPGLPGRSFSLKGFFVGAVLWFLLFLFKVIGGGAVQTVAWALLICAITSFVTMNFTGSTTYTSLSGVLKEMRVALPLQIGAALFGLGAWIVTRFL